ncbi:hypothetical protein [Rhodococcus rhodochrous]|uniref:Rv1733c family protein n=1 Tax=Rhodococcus rhodochrous TaxID=1829 RepID=UPI00036F00EC|nr:hypothetical protein [Rhodococcus rhodochrous]
MDDLRVLATRWWRASPCNPNPLMRGRDRAANLAALLAIVCAVLMVPVAAAIGTADYAHTRAETDRARIELRQVTAVLSADPYPDDTGVEVAPARWHVDDSEHLAEVRTPPGARLGDTLPVWVDTEGRPVGAPPSGTIVALDAIATAVTVWLGAAGILGLAVSVLRRVAARHRMRAWDREWESFDRTPGRPPT